MNVLRLDWFDIGLGFALLIGIFLAFARISPLAFLFWANLICLFLHQAEEYRYPVSTVFALTINGELLSDGMTAYKMFHC